jgi:hypothetical protein
MVATVKVLTGRATDDVLELFDLLMVADLMSKAERESRDEKLRRYPRVSRYAGKLASAVKVLLEMTEAEPGLSLDMMWDLIENTATKSELRAAVAVIHIGIDGHYAFHLPDLGGSHRPLRDPDSRND